MHRYLTGTAVALALMSTGLSAARAESADQQIEKKEQPFALKLGATRVIYRPGSAGASLNAINPQDYPMLVKSQVFDEDKKTLAPFIVTPPLFRLDGQQSSRLRIIGSRDGSLPADRETLKWLCVTGVPPKGDDAWAKGGQKPTHATLNIQVSVSSCIKLLVRPEAVRGGPESVADGLSWRRQGATLKVTNPTPFYLNLKSLTVGGKKVEAMDYVPPFGTRDFALPSGASGQVAWRILTDLGGDSRLYKADLQ
ncbi:fimbria/pilus periplasmic chaperone [Serratia ureilytica]|uniref:fimbria/pilus periplasmic chaperone n=1 Tax=Serratia ureilytica TaxID=300181 RepID=UPI00313E918C